MPLTSISFPKPLTSSSSSPWPSPLTSSTFFTPKGPNRWPTIIRMGGGPRTYPGGVSKWQWKRMQAKKAKQLLQARLARERQIYEMRKRAELKAALSGLERPWEPVRAATAASNLFSVAADEQVKVLADRFQKPGGMDLWTDRDGPQLFHTPEGFPSARFFPKGVVHSVRPYGKVSGSEEEEEAAAVGGEWRTGRGRGRRGRGRGRGRGRINGSVPRGMEVAGELGERRVKSRTRWDSSEGVIGSDSLLRSARQGRGGSPDSRESRPGEVYDRNWEDDGSYGKSTSSWDRRSSVSRSGRNVASRPTSERVASSSPRFQLPRRGRGSGRGRGGRFGRGGSRGSRESRPDEIYDMSLANDGSYGFEVDDRGQDW